jgi:hypothetical protein
VVGRTTAVLDRVAAYLHAAQPTIGPPRGTPLPHLDLVDGTGQPVALATFRGAPLVLLMLAPGCGPCNRLLDRMRQQPVNLAPASRVVAVTEPAAREAIAASPLPAWITVLYRPDERVLRTLGLDRTPWQSR